MTSKRAKIVSCERCNGTGENAASQEWFITPRPCRKCSGTGVGVELAAEPDAEA